MPDTGPYRPNMYRACILLMAAGILACDTGPAVPLTEVAGTWGGDNAGLIVSDTVAHIHIGCTLGYARTPLRLNADGRFETTGTYNVDAYPVDRGTIHPAAFTGQVKGNSLSLSVVLTDNGRQLGPVTLIYKREPKMGPCPICRTASPASAARQLESLRLQGHRAGAGTSPISSRN